MAVSLIGGSFYVRSLQKSPTAGGLCWVALIFGNSHMDVMGNPNLPDPALGQSPC